MQVKSLQKPVIILITSLILGGCSLKPTFDKKPAGLDITTTPKAQVFLSGKLIGETPYKNDNIKAADYTLQLVPVATDSATTLEPWETKLTLTPQATTIITRSFAPSLSEVESSILQLLPVSGSKSSYLSVISDPDSANVTIDNKPYGFTPISKIELMPGNHSLMVSSPGYRSQSLSVNTAVGYNLVVNIHLGADSLVIAPKTPSPESTLPESSSLPTISPNPVEKPVSTSSAKIVAKPYVVINNTPDTESLGGLKVRTEGNSAGSPLGLAKIDEKLPYLDTNNLGWHQVTFEGQKGWVSGKYSTVVK